MDNKQIITADLGNSYVKIGYFRNGELEDVKRVLWTEIVGDVTLQNEFNTCRGIFSSVLSAGQNQIFKELFPLLIQFDGEIRLPVKLNYKTPDTLGKDRVCNAVGAWSGNRDQNSLVVDIGTCIKFDFVSKDGVYEGGSISPGMHLRYKSLNDYTANLPLLNETGRIDLTGKSTKESIHSGVINGITAEIHHLIALYERKYGLLTIFVTGGDAKYFDLETKNNIFANKNLTLEGLYQIYLFNAQ